jgi:hypothetical protein
MKGTPFFYNFWFLGVQLRLLDDALQENLASLLTWIQAIYYSRWYSAYCFPSKKIPWCTIWISQSILRQRFVYTIAQKSAGNFKIFVIFPVMKIPWKFQFTWLLSRPNNPRKNQLIPQKTYTAASKKAMHHNYAKYRYLVCFVLNILSRKMISLFLLCLFGWH